MTRKDIIIISVLINAGLLTTLFVTAIRQDNVPMNLNVENPSELVQEAAKTPIIQEIDVTQPPLLVTSSQDEVDLILKDYIPYMAPISEPAVELIAEVPIVKNKEPITSDEIGEYVDIKVKKGDMLEKIARANGVTVEEIKRINRMTNDKLKIGQVLKVPVAIPVVKAPEAAPAKVIKEVTDAVYYTVKSGDNPWKIAKQFHVRFDDILKLNNLNEEKARNLKIGDKIRVK